MNKEKTELQEKLLNVPDKNEEIIQLQKEHKAELKEATDKIEKLLIMINNKDNDIVYLATRGLGSRIRNKLTPRIEATIIEVEAKDVSEE